MKHLILTLAVSSVCLFAGAQNYQCLQPGVKHYFTNANGYLRGIRIDSVRSFADSTVYYPFHTPRGNYSTTGALDGDGSSWLGGRVLEDINGTFIFNNFLHDTVVIKTQAGVGDSWVFYDDSTSIYYRADMIGIDTMTISGSLDSVKRMMITARNPSGIVTSDPVDSFLIVLSKNHGFVQVFDLYMFPYHLPGAAYASGLDYYLDLAGGSIFRLSNFPDPAPADLYQWNAGDVYEWSSCSGRCILGATCTNPDTYQLDTITAVMPGSPSILYDYSGVTTSGDGVHLDTHYGSSTFTPSAAKILGGLMPEETGEPLLTYFNPTDSGYCIASPMYKTLTSRIVGATYYPPFEASQVYNYYKVPLGLVYYYHSNVGDCPVGTSMLTVEFNVYATTLLYYNRAGESCGAPKYAASTPIVTPRYFLSLYPNPATNELIVSASEDILSVVVSDITGRLMSAYSGNGKELRVDVRGLAAGVYFVRVNGTEVRKFVKE